MEYTEQMKKRPEKNISAVILAGGAGTRFDGGIKYKSLVKGRKIIERITVTLNEIFDEVIIVTNSPEEFDEFDGYTIVTDQFKGMGPLAGIHAAMKVSSNEAIFVFASDMPFLSSRLILDQISFARDHKSDAIIPEINSMIEPLHGIYRRQLADELERLLSSGQNLSVRGFIGRIDTAIFRPEISEEVLKAFININTSEDAGRFR